MKKRTLIGATLLTAALAISASMTAFAAGWTQDTNGWGYQRENGSWVGMGWFTDPADGSVYFLDPDGYMMTETHVEGYRLGADGRRVEKTADDIQKEQDRKQALANKKTPAKGHAAADLAADAAKSSNAAMSTTRLSYQAELKKLMDIIYIDAGKALNKELIKSSTTEDNLETTYRFSMNGNHSIVTSIWKSSNKKSSHYVPNALSLSYNRNAVSDEASVTILDSTFRRLMVASLGESTGNALLDNIFAENAKGNAKFEWNGNSDSGNQYNMICNNGTISITVTCSEQSAAAVATETDSAAETPDETE